MFARFRRKGAVPPPDESVRRIYAIGDVHGRYDLFRQLMAIIERDQAERASVRTLIVLLGDIIDRGPDSARMVQGCMRLTTLTDRFILLRGNHEQMMVEALQGNLTVYRHWLRFGGRETLRSWGVDPAVLDAPATKESLHVAAEAVGAETIRWLAELPLHHRHGNYLFVHAGIRPGIAIDRQHSDDLLWIKDEFLESDAEHGMIVVHGHSISESGVVMRANRIGIDTGAYRTHQLTALGIDDGEVWILQTAEMPQLQLTSDDAELINLARQPLKHADGNDSDGREPG